ncbi:MAG: hypothetical protein ABH845_04600 [Candidatus Omnitrophota bacterium]
MKQTLFFILLWSCIFSHDAFAKPPSISARVNKEVITVGDEIIYELETTHSSSVLIDFPKEDDADFAPFEMKRYRPLPRREAGDQVSEGRQYVLTIFKLGRWKIPALEIPYTDYRQKSIPESTSPTERYESSGMGTRRTVTIQSIEIEVKSILGEGMPETLDIQRLKTPGESRFWKVFQKAGLALFAIGILFLGSYGFIRFMPKPVPRISREDPAIAALRELHAFKKKHGREAPFAGHYEMLTRILRHYLARQFDPLRLDLTSTELHQQMTQYRPCQAIAEGVRQILTVADLVKFSDRKASQEEFEMMLRDSEEIIRYKEAAPSNPVT